MLRTLGGAGRKRIAGSHGAEVTHPDKDTSKNSDIPVRAKKSHGSN